MGYTFAPYLFAMFNMPYVAYAFMKHHGWLLGPELSRMILFVHVVVTLPAVMIATFWFWYAPRTGDVGKKTWKVSLVGLLVPAFSVVGIPNVESYYSDVAGFIVILVPIGILMYLFVRDIKKMSSANNLFKSFAPLTGTLRRYAP